MTDEQYKAHLWLSRMWGKEKEIDAKVMHRDKVSSWGVGIYDAKHIPGGADQNTNESKFINYALMSEEIDKDIQTYLRETRRTEEVINTAKETLLRGILYDFYINQKTCEEVRTKYHYSKTRFYELRNAALTEVIPNIPFEEVILDD